MAYWKKSFKKLPKKIAVELENLDSENAKVLAGKLIDPQEIEDGEYSHLGLTIDTLEVGRTWEIIPDHSVGTQSKRNAEGWVHVRKDLPKFTKYYYRDIENFGNAARNGWSTVAIPREVYERDEYPPYLFHIEVNIQEILGDGRIGVVFSVDEVFLATSPSFDGDFLSAINLLQENTGVSGVVSAENPEFVFTSGLNWSLFPPGDLEAVATSLSSGPRAIAEDVVRERLQLFDQFQPTEYLRGLGGNDHYIGAKYAEDLVVFENLKYGNALYVLYRDWQALSQQPRSDILRLRTSQFDRIIHTDGWENRFAVLMQKELAKRGIRIRIGRNMRRRRR
jgi:hypothetical protein